MAGRLEALQPAGFPVGQHINEEVGVDDGPRNMPGIGREKAQDTQKTSARIGARSLLRAMRLFAANPLPKLDPPGG